MRKEIIGIGLVLSLGFFIIGCEKPSNEKTENDQIEISKNKNIKEMKLMNSYKGNIDEFIEIDSIVVDLNEDGEEEEILLLGKGTVTYLDEAMLAIRDGKDKSLLFAIESDTTQIKFQDVVDIDKDGLKEILVEVNGGGNMPSQTKLYVYDKDLRGYNEVEIIKSDLEAKLINDFKVRIIEKNTNTYIEQKISDKNIKNIIEFYDTKGNVIGEADQMISCGQAIIEDYNKDGSLEYVVKDYVLGGSRADILATTNTIYKYENGTIKILGILNEAVEEREFKKFKDDNTIVKKESGTKINKQISEEERRKKAIQTLYDIGALDSTWDIAEIGDHGTASKHLEKDYYYISAKNIHPQDGYDHGICYFVNKKDFSVLTGGPTVTGLEIREYGK